MENVSVKPMTDAGFASATAAEQFESLVRLNVQHQNKMSIRLRLADKAGRSIEDYRAEIDAEVSRRLNKK